MTNTETMKVNNEYLLENINRNYVHNKNFKSLAGRRIDKIDVISEVGVIHIKNKHGSSYRSIYLCKCNICGEYSYLRDTSLYVGISRGHLSCGCIAPNNKINTHNNQDRIHHNRTDKPNDLFKALYQIFSNIQKNKYNAIICDEWNGYDKFENFYNWAIENGYTLNRSRIIRNPYNGPFSPETCKITHDFIYYKKFSYAVYKNYAYKISEWAEMLEITRKALANRISVYGWPLEYALTCPNQNKHPKIYLDIDKLITPEWRAKNQYEEFKKLGIID